MWWIILATLLLACGGSDGPLPSSPWPESDALSGRCTANRLGIAGEPSFQWSLHVAWPFMWVHCEVRPDGDLFQFSMDWPVESAEAYRRDCAVEGDGAAWTFRLREEGGPIAPVFTVDGVVYPFETWECVY